MIKKLLMIGIGGYILYYISLELYTVYTTQGIPTDISYSLLLLGSLCYFLSHFMRAIRLLILAGDPNISARALVSAQYMANGVNLMLPFKLGEVYRVIRFEEFFKSKYRSFIFLLVERIFDFSMILSLFLVFQFLFGTNDIALESVKWFAILFFVGAFFVLFVLKDILQVLERYIVQRYTSKLLLLLAKTINAIHNIILEIHTVLHKKWLSCFSLTVCVWGLELLAFTGFYSITGSVESVLFLAIFVFLASLLPSGPMGYGGVQLAFFWVGSYWNIPDFIGYSVWYNIFIFIPAVVFGMAIFLSHKIYRVDKKTL